MLSKRFFWLVCAIIAGWLIWVRLRQRRDEFAASTPHFAPPRTFAPYTPAAPPATLPDPNQAPAAPATAISNLAEAPAEAPAALPDLDEPSAAPEPAPPAAASVPANAGHAAERVEADEAAEISGYCMRCKTKRLIQNAHRETTESGRPAARGTCPICGANMFTFLATDNDNT